MQIDQETLAEFGIQRQVIENLGPRFVDRLRPMLKQ
jgi:hypothetical protein